MNARHLIAAFAAILFTSQNMFAASGGYLIDEDGAEGPLPPSLEFHHGSWKFGEGTMIGEQVPTENHMATIKALMAFDQMKVEWKMKFAVPNQRFLFVAWPAESSGHAMDFNFVPDTGEMSLVRPKSKDKDSAVLAKGKLTKVNTGWHELTCTHDGPNFTLTIDGVTITAADESFNRPMGPFYLNGGGFNGAKFQVKDLKVSALPGSPTTRKLLPATKPKTAAVPAKPLPPQRTYHAAADDRVLSDFEGDSFGDWTTRGDTFGNGPQEVADCKNRPARANSKRLANSFRPNDKTTGSLISPAFTIDRRHLHFLIGGGPHEGLTCFNLIVDGKTLRTATGCGRKNDQQKEIMLWDSWDLKEFQGKTATLQIVDNHTGGWGHIQVDHPVLSHTPLE
jgi:hypothetical protein